MRPSWSKTTGYVRSWTCTNRLASARESFVSTPTTTSPWARSFCHRRSSTGASRLHGPHQEAKKLSTTVRPHSDASEISPVPLRRPSEKAGARAPTFGGGVWWVRFHTRSVASSPTPATASACAPSFSGPRMAGLRRNDEHRRPDPHASEQPLGRRHLHPDAAVRLGWSDRPRLGGALAAAPRRAQPHPARAQRVARPGRDGLQPLRPRVLGRRIPPRVDPLDDDLEWAQPRRVVRRPRGDREGGHEAPAELAAAAVG